MLIYAQHEVAGVLASKYQLTAGVVSIATPSAARSTGPPLPTPDSVAVTIVKQAGAAVALGKVAVITHLNQASLAVRC
ncbi:hypothetical protein [Burkholderia sp. MSMB1078WGS]|uniref:hypothetical protein n=1 Tax=Burkholderia sp. MSMB1078WGS TaxID=1637900 RepID=UPI00211D8EF5|nr:hypothetical protein [Burkholderia sp. MSMB1078WGS]